ncbi:hypothetical protein FOZ62_002635, partial [Perkinsus olseni]
SLLEGSLSQFLWTVIEFATRELPRGATPRMKVSIMPVLVSQASSSVYRPSAGSQFTVT